MLYLRKAYKIYDYLGLRDREDVVLCEPVPDDVADKIQTILRDGELGKKANGERIGVGKELLLR